MVAGEHEIISSISNFATYFEKVVTFTGLICYQVYYTATLFLQCTPKHTNDAALAQMSEHVSRHKRTYRFSNECLIHIYNTVQVLYEVSYKTFRTQLAIHFESG